MKPLFWISFLLVFYTYAGYPILLAVLNALFRRPVSRGDGFPDVTLLIAARNEEKDIGRKLANTRSLDYPREKLRILVVSDASTDSTDRIVGESGDSRVLLVRTPERRGKTGAQNVALESVSGEIVVFSDATTNYAQDALRKIVRSFSDPEVGGVEGRLVYVASGTGFMGDKDIWKTYEAWIKRMESGVRGGVGDNGAFYAIRKELCLPLPEDLTSDFAAPLQVCRLGKRFVFDPEAVSYENASPGSGDEYRRKVRTVCAGVTVFIRSLDLLNPLTHPWTAFVLVSRKMCRWTSSLFLAPLFISSLLLMEQGFYSLVFAAQCAFYLLALAGILVGDSSDRVRLLSIPKNFLLVNVAAVQGVWRGLGGHGTEVWTPHRTPGN